MTRSLTPRQARFCAEYIADENGPRAALRAGYTAHTARLRGWQMSRAPHIRARIEDLRQERRSTERLSQQGIVVELAKIAFCDLSAIADEAGNIISLEAARKALSGAVATLEISESAPRDGGAVKRTCKVTTWDKFKALDRLSQMLKAEAETEAEGRALRPMDETDFAAGARMAAILAAVKARESGLAD